MSDLLILLGFAGLLTCLAGLAKGSVRSLGLSSRQQCAKAAAAAFVVMMVGGGLAPEQQDTVEPVAQPAPVDRVVPTTPQTATPQSATTRASRSPEPSPAGTPDAAPTTVPTSPSAPASPGQTGTAPSLLVMAAGGDGDSWRDTNGVEYRMGLVNAPETNECGGAAATAYRKRMLADGFRAEVYATDTYGRKVAVIRTAGGANLNVAMARDGIADDDYLARFRHEHRGLAAELDDAFAQARAARRGIWASCGQPAAPARTPSTKAPAATVPSTPTPPPPGRSSSCHPDYSPCIPVKGDGSGRGDANDLDCGQVGRTVQVAGRDPYRLDADDDGKGCE